MKNIFTILLLFSLLSCHKKYSNPNIATTETKKQVKDKSYYYKLKKSALPFFEFDEIEYYHMDITFKKILNTYNGEHKQTSSEKTLGKYINSWLPISLEDKKFIPELKQYFTYNCKINDRDFKNINTIFSEKYEGAFPVTTCTFVYRDILVFKKNNKISGVGKICFSCGEDTFTGTTRNTDGFGQNGDNEKLKHILRKYLPKNSIIDYKY